MQELTTFISNHPMLSLAVIIVLGLLLIVEILRAKRNTFNISPLQATHLINREHANVIDIRSKAAYQAGHIIEAQLFNPTDIKNNLKKIEKFKARPLIIVCNTGMESQKMAVFLLGHGYNAYSIAGGMRAWTAAPMPVVKSA